MNTNEIEQAYKNLIKATNQLFDTAQVTNKLAIVLAEKEAHVAASLNLKSDGMPDNETTRRAAIKNGSRAEFSAWQAARDDQVEAQNWRDVAAMVVQMNRDLLKLLEIGDKDELFMSEKQITPTETRFG